MKNLKHVFFDLDHTLWDFEKNSSEALLELYHELRLSEDIADVQKFIQTYQEINARYWHLYNHGKVSKEQVRTGRFLDTLNTFKVRNSDNKAIELGNEYVLRSPHKKHIFPFAHEALTYLNEKYALHIITNGFLEVQHTKTEVDERSIASTFRPYLEARDWVSINRGKVVPIGSSNDEEAAS